MAKRKKTGKYTHRWWTVEFMVESPALGGTMRPIHREVVAIGPKEALQIGLIQQQFAKDEEVRQAKVVCG